MTVPAERVSGDEVLRALAAGRDITKDSGPWTTRFLSTATAQFQGRWQSEMLAGAALEQIWLPPHAGEPCRGDRIALVPHGGANVATTAAHLRESTAAYARANPCCWSRIEAAMHEPLSPIILTTRPLDEDEYRSVRKDRGDRLYHLDGLHRLVAWALADRLTPEVRVRAFVAG
jgi:hypothetical protein